MNVTEFKLAPGLGMLDARDRNTKLGMADAGLIAGDTGTDVIDPAFARFPRHVRIGDQRPRHAAHIGSTSGDDALRFLRLVDAARHEDRLADRLLELCRQA